MRKGKNDLGKRIYPNQASFDMLLENILVGLTKDAFTKLGAIWWELTLKGGRK